MTVVIISGQVQVKPYDPFYFFDPLIQLFPKTFFLKLNLQIKIFKELTLFDHFTIRASQIQYSDDKLTTVILNILTGLN